MMFHFPYFNMPYYGRSSRYGYHYPYYTYKNKYSNFKNSTYNENTNNNNNVSKEYSKLKSVNNFKNKEQTNSSDANNPIFQLFGIDLYFDDILIVFLIWFLYNEDVKDEGLFITLIMLLLS